MTESGQIDMKNLTDAEWITDSMVDRLSASGDTTGIPYYHYRWKKKWLADFVARPTSPEQVSEILKLATRKGISVTPRGGGTCYYGSASPTRGGIMLDIKLLDNVLEVNKEEMWVHVQAGAVWEVLDNYLRKRGFTLTVQPQSAVASVLAGWLAIGGKAGIGSPKFGTVLENINEMTVARPNGDVETITGDDMKLFYGTSGIAGIVISMKLKIRPVPEAFEGVMFAFAELEKAIEAVERICQLKHKPIYLKLTDREYEWRVAGGLPPHITGNYFVLVAYDGKPLDVSDSVNEANGIFRIAGADDLGSNYFEKSWNDRFIVEMKLKLEVPTLSMQNLWIPLSNIKPITDRMYKIARKYKINSCFYLVMGEGTKARLCLFAPSDHRHWMHFMAGKTMLHRLAKFGYQHGGELYTLGLQNTVYLKKFQPDDYSRFQEIRRKWDPKGIMNPDKLTHANMTYRRMNLMFTMNGNFRRLQSVFRRAKNILQISDTEVR
ncbi:MAG: FAD-binding oxidoreductase [Candidatus Thorarchaeota archaeon]|jgi:glycolate oxidase